MHELKLSGEWLTLKNEVIDKQNEDGYAIDSVCNLYCVVDGVSRDRINGAYPQPSPAKQATELFVRSLQKNYSALLPDNKNRFEKLLKASMIRANQLIGEFNRENNYHVFPAGVVALAVTLVKSTMYFCFIGDCWGIHLSKGNMEVFSVQQTSRIRKNRNQYTKEYIRNSICNNPNHQESYGVLDGRNSAAHFLVSGKRNVQPGDVIILCTDGMEPILTWQLRSYLMESGCQSLLEMVKAIEKSQGIPSDDKTIIKLLVEES